MWKLRGGCYDFFDLLLKVLHFQFFFWGVGEDIWDKSGNTWTWNPKHAQITMIFAFQLHDSNFHFSEPQSSMGRCDPTQHISLQWAPRNRLVLGDQKHLHKMACNTSGWQSLNLIIGGYIELVTVWIFRFSFLWGILQSYIFDLLEDASNNLPRSISKGLVWFDCCSYRTDTQSRSKFGWF